MCAKTLTAVAQRQLTNKDVKIEFIFTINNIDYSSYLINWNVSHSTDFGSAIATFTLNNDSGLFGESGANKINIGDVVSFTEKYGGDTEIYKRFYGFVNQRTINKSSSDRNITFVCLDYISRLQFLEIDLEIEGTKVEVTNETLTPNYLETPNDSLAQLFDFANNALADNPRPNIIIKNKNTNAEDPQFDGYNLLYDAGQLKLGYPLNAKYNYDLIVSSYYFYTQALYVEDILETILKEVDGYCYSSDTEVLTENGWMLLKDIVDNKLKIKIATLNPEKDLVEYHYPTDYIKQMYSGIMLHQEGKRIDFKVTPNHTVWAKQISSWTNYDYQFYKASELPQHIIYRKDFPYKAEELEYFILPEYNHSFSKIDYRSGEECIYNINKPELKIKMDGWLRFFGIWIAEGWVNKDYESGNYSIVKISQSPTWKQEIMNKWMEDCGFTYTYNEKAKEFTINSVQLAQYLKQFGKSHDKFIPRELLNSLSKRQLEILLEALMLGDGKITQTTRSYCTVSKQLADDVQELALKCGYSPNLFFVDNVIFNITLATRKESMPNQGRDNRNLELYDDFVYCLTVPNHLLYVRRNGKGCWCGNSKYLFDETTVTDFVNNHLIDTFLNIEGTTTDYLTPNVTSSTIAIKTNLTSAVSEGATSINVVSTAGFATSGQGSINGDIFTWTGKTLTTLTGIPSTGSYALKSKPNGSYVKYETSYAAGTVWYLSYNNLQTDLVAGNFTIPGGTFSYLDKRYGRIILTAPISISTTVTSNVDYSFKTLQATGIELNKISFPSRSFNNRFEAIKQLFSYLAPNYVIRTQGDNKIWASYLTQKTNADYTLELVEDINYIEDTDLCTRVLFYTNNKNPTNLMFNDGVDFITTGEDYTAYATNSELVQLRDEGNYYIYGLGLGTVGQITANSIKPIIYLNSVPIDNTSHIIPGQAVTLETTTRTDAAITTGGK